MKKIISLGVASAICALTAISASAANATKAYWDHESGEKMTGKQIKVDIIANQDVVDCSFTVTGTGLTIESVKNPTEGLMLNNFNDKKGFFAVSGGSNTVAKAGEVLCTITATVTGAAGSTAKIEVVSGDDGAHTAKLPDVAYSFEVKGAEESKPADTSKPAEESKPAETSKPAEESKPAETSKPAEESKPEQKPGSDNPGTGVALAVVPAVLAAAGVIVAKKRK